MSQVCYALGDKAVDFCLPDSDGTEVRLSELTSERPVLLIFYRGHW